MTEPIKPKEPKVRNEEPGLFDSIGSFPVWLLKIIDLLTPDCLIKKAPPKQDSPKK